VWIFQLPDAVVDGCYEAATNITVANAFSANCILASIALPAACTVDHGKWATQSWKPPKKQ
jgi:hypothetical protein